LYWKTSVLQRLASIVTLSLAFGAGCGAPDTASGEGSQIDAVVSATASPSETNCRGSEPAPASGTPLWLQRYDAVEISGVAADSRGNLLIARSNLETRALGCGGEQLWSVPFGARVAVDHADNVYVAGTRSDGSPFVTKLDGSGGVVYEADLGDELSGELDSLAVDASQNVAISGPVFGTAKLDAAGALRWRQPFSGKLAFDGDGDLWLTGALEGSRDFAGTTLTSQGGTDVLLLELAPDGNLRSARSFGDAGAQQRGEAIAVDAANDVLVTGTFDGSVDFGAGALEHRPQSCSPDAWCLTSGFVAKLDAQGSAQWTISLGLTRAVPGVAADVHGDIAVSSVLPGGVRPFRRPRVSLLGPDGGGLWQQVEWPDTGIGAGHGIAFDANQDVIWSISARPSLELEEQAYLAKLLH
jgi:hypothetical protein